MVAYVLKTGFPTKSNQTIITAIISIFYLVISSLDILAKSSVIQVQITNLHW